FLLPISALSSPVYLLCRRAVKTRRLFRFRSPPWGGEAKKECVLEPVHLHSAVDPWTRKSVAGHAA
ncbi:MAG: hypothetical protein VX213_09840, partial [Chloroflexota bacterium]|nr:hypothetical protein [Chloroflexota bacterium]